MSLYELESMMRSLPKPEAAPMTTEQFDATKDKWRKMGLADVKV